MNYDKWVVITSAYASLRGSKEEESVKRSRIRACTRDATGFIIANRTKIVGVAPFFLIAIFVITSERRSLAVPMFPNLDLATYLIKYYGP